MELRKVLALSLPAPYIITQEEAAEFFRLPIGSNTVSAGLVINESGKLSRTYAKDIINSGDITAGKLKSSMNNDTIGFSVNDLTKHMLVAGTPGSGKTNFSVSLLIRLGKNIISLFWSSNLLKMNIGQ